MAGKHKAEGPGKPGPKEKLGKKSRTAPSAPKCNYCATRLPCVRGDALDRDYWTLYDGPRICDECLLEQADDFDALTGWQRLFALRLLHVAGIDLAQLDATVSSANGIIVPQQVDYAQRWRAAAFSAFADGEKRVAMTAAQAYWNDVNALQGALVNRKAILAGKRVSDGGRKGAAASRETRRGSDSKRHHILRCAAEYEGNEAGKVATIARKTSSTTRYVREVLRKAEP